jgi:hypothetical protein
MNELVAEFLLTSVSSAAVQLEPFFPPFGKRVITLENPF